MFFSVQKNPLPPFIRRRDFFLLIPLAAAVLCLLLFPKTKGDTAVVKQAGRVIYTLPLSRQTQIPVSGNGYSLTLQVQNGTVTAFNSTCPDKTCTRMGPIASPGQSIVCLPAELTVTVTGDAPDGIAR